MPASLLTRFVTSTLAAGLLGAVVGLAPHAAVAATLTVPTNVVTDTAAAGVTGLGSSITFTATVSGPKVPTGEVAWSVSGSAGTTACKTSKTALSIGKATCTVTASSAGTYVVSDTYAGSNTYAAATSTPDTVTVAPAGPANVVTNSTTATKPASVGTTVTFTAMVTGVSGAATPSGAVIWSVSGSAGSTACQSATATLAAGRATCVVAISASGTYAVSDTYAGDANYISTTSAANSITVAALPVPTNVVTDTSTASTGLGSSVTFTATVSGAKVPTGAVTWSVSGSAGITACKTSKTSLSVGRATCTLTTSSAGSYVVSDTYAGSSTYSPVTSSPDTVTVGRVIPSNVVTNSTSAAKPASEGTSVTFTAIVTGSSGAATPTGVITWSVGGSAGITACQSATASLVAGRATCTVATSAPGTYAVSDTYAGDANYTGTTSAASLITVAALAVPTAIPVMDWHELNNGCLATAAVCDAADVESVSTKQLKTELAYLVAQGFHTVTPAQYVAWTQGSQTPLPLNPILLVADNGIESFLVGAQPILKADGFTMAVAVVSGFADGASNICTEPDNEPGCPSANNNGWDATWAQLAGLSPSVYSFILEAGTAGHFVQTYDPNCTVFYACEMPGETAAAYETRVEADIATGQSAIISKLGASRYTPGMWVIPYSDDGYTPCTATGCISQPSDGPTGWLPSWTASTFPVAFVQDAFRNGIQNERFRIDVQGWMTESDFEGTLNTDLTTGDFTLAHTAAPVPPPPPPTSTTPVAAIPVLSLDSTTVTTDQVVAELSYLQAQGDNTITAASYVSWAEGNTVALPADPVLITVTGGNDALLVSISPYLIADGYSAVDFVSTQQADAGGDSATWSELALLPPAAWQFSFSSGANGDTPVAGDPSSCDYFYACESPGQSDADYQAAVAADVGAGRLELDNALWMQTVNDFLWSAPFGDAGQPGQPSDGPVGWLAQWSSYVFPVVFVASGAAGNNEHTVLSVDGSTTEATFEASLSSDLSGGLFSANQVAG